MFCRLKSAKFHEYPLRTSPPKKLSHLRWNPLQKSELRVETIFQRTRSRRVFMEFNWFQATEHLQGRKFTASIGLYRFLLASCVLQYNMSLKKIVRFCASDLPYNWTDWCQHGIHIQRNIFFLRDPMINPLELSKLRHEVQTNSGNYYDWIAELGGITPNDACAVSMFFYPCVLPIR